jgi:hypothetical protein
MIAGALSAPRVTANNCSMPDRIIGKVEYQADFSDLATPRS